MRSIIQATVVATFGTLLLVATADAESVHVRLRVAGAVTRTQVDNNGDGFTADAFHFRAKGHPGTAVIIGQSEFAPPVLGFLLGCAPEFEVAFAFLAGRGQVYTFNDLSTLRVVTTGDGVFCFDLNTFGGEGTNPFSVVGGSGRFEGANGLLTVQFLATSFNPTGTIEVRGRITGDVQIP